MKKKTPGTARKTMNRKPLAAKAAKKSIKHKTTAKQVLSDDEFVGGLWDFFSDLPAFTFVADFPGREWWPDGPPLAPTLTSVVDLLICARQGSPYRGPYADTYAVCQGLDIATAAKRRRKIVGEVESRIAELRRRDIEFGICWCAHDAKGDVPRIDWSGNDEDLYNSDVYERLAEHCKEHLDMMLELI
jgi:hypothetical protein